MMSRRKYKYIITTIYIVIILFTFLFFNGNINYFMGFCEVTTLFLSSIPFVFSFFIFLMLLSMLYSYLLRIKYSNRIFVIRGVPFLILSLFLTSIFHKKRNYLTKSENIITKGVLEYSPSPGKQSATIYFKYSKKDKSISISQPLSNKIAKNLKRNDTILIMYSKECPVMLKVFKYFPSDQDLKMFKNDRYYKAGKVLEEVSSQ